MKKSEAGNALLVSLVVLALAGLAMFLLHFWQLPDLLKALLPLARGSIAFFLGGAAFNAVGDLRDSRETKALTHRSIQALVLFGLLAVYIIPTYCNYLHFKSELESSSNPSLRVEAGELGFPAYLHIVGTTPTKFDPEDAPEGEGFFDILVSVAMLIDVLIQKLCTNVLHVAVAGYASLGVWYLMFLLFCKAGEDLFYNR